MVSKATSRQNQGWMLGPGSQGLWGPLGLLNLQGGNAVYSCTVDITERFGETAFLE